MMLDYCDCTPALRILKGSPVYEGAVGGGLLLEEQLMIVKARPVTSDFNSNL